MVVLPLSSTYYDLAFSNGCWELVVSVGDSGVRRASDMSIDVSPAEIVLQVTEDNEVRVRIPPHAQVDVDSCSVKLSKGVLRLSWPPVLGDFKRECVLQTLSSSPLIVVAHDFLDPAICRTIIEAAKKHGRPHYDMNNVDVKYDMDDKCDFNGAHQRLLQSVNNRVDALCGTNLVDLPRTWNPEDDPPRVHFQSPLRTSADGVRTPLGLHVDTNGRPFRFVTVIIYLATLPQQSGDGATIFPCADVGGNGKTREIGYELIKGGAEHTRICSHDEELKPLAQQLERAVSEYCGLSVFP